MKENPRKSRKFSRVLAAAALLGLPAIAIACASLIAAPRRDVASLPPPAVTISDGQLAALLQHDFSAGIAAQRMVRVSDEAALQFSPQPRLGVIPAQLTAEDERVLAFYDLEGKWPLHWRDTIGRVMLYYQRHGVFPPTGAHLFADLLTPEGYARFEALSPAQQFADYGWGVNFATGRFHDSFTAAAWRPGAMYFWPAAADSIRLGGLTLPLGDVLRRPAALVAAYRIYGSQPQGVLLESLTSVAPPVAEQGLRGRELNPSPALRPAGRSGQDCGCTPR